MGFSKTRWRAKDRPIYRNLRGRTLAGSAQVKNEVRLSGVIEAVVASSLGHPFGAMDNYAA